VWISYAMAAGGMLLVALTSRFAPDLFSDRGLHEVLPGAIARLSFPVGYWNGLAIFVALGFPLLLRAAVAARTWWWRAAAIAPLPAMAGVIYLTSSRGGVAVAVVASAAFVILSGRVRALVAGAVAAAGSAAAVAILAARDVLTDGPFDSSAASDAGAEGALLLAAVCLVLALAYGVLSRPLSLRLAMPRLAWPVIALVAVVGLLAADPAGRFEDFKERPPEAPGAVDVGAHLTSGVGSGRWQFWSAAADQWREHPVAGDGAGSFEPWGAQHGTLDWFVRNAHSLWLETLGELGIVGLLLVGGAIGLILWRLASLARARDRPLYAALLAGALVWAIQAGFDWHWEMPVVTLWFFALGGAAIARVPTDPPRDPAPALLPRLAVAAACCALLLVPVRLALSQDRLESGLSALQLGRCDRATKAAERSLDAIGGRPEPYEIEATCALIDRQPSSAMRLMSQALRRDPANWRLHYGLAVSQARAGRDPRRSANAALRLNPQEVSARDAVKRFEAVTSGGRSGDGGSARAWQRTSRLMLNELPPR
jgi:hypothetical protein